MTPRETASFLALSGLLSFGVSIAVTQFSEHSESNAPAVLHDTWPQEPDAVQPTAPTQDPSEAQDLQWMRLRNRDTQIDAAYSAGYSAARNYVDSRHFEDAVRDCTRQLMECRHPNGMPEPDAGDAP